MFTEKDFFDFEWDKIYKFSEEIDTSNKRLEYFLFVQKEAGKVQEILKEPLLEDFFKGKIYRDGLGPFIDVHSYLIAQTVEESDRTLLIEFINNIENDFLRRSYQRDLKKYDFKQYGNFMYISEDVERKLDSLMEKLKVEIDYLKEILSHATNSNNGKGSLSSEHIKVIEKRNLTNPKIRINSSLSDVVRIFEAMKDAGIISSKTEVKQIVDLFNDPKINEAKYNANKSRIDNQESTSKSKELKEFIKKITENSFKGKYKVLSELIQYFECLYSP